MGDSYRTLTVVLSNNVDQDDIGEVIYAIRSFRFVADVTPHPVDIGTYTALSMARHEIRDQIRAILWPPTKP